MLLAPVPDQSSGTPTRIASDLAPSNERNCLAKSAPVEYVSKWNLRRMERTVGLSGSPSKITHAPQRTSKYNTKPKTRDYMALIQASSISHPKFLTKLQT